MILRHCFWFRILSLIRHSNFGFRVLGLCFGFQRLYHILRGVHRYCDASLSLICGLGVAEKEVFHFLADVAEEDVLLFGVVEVADDLDGDGIVLDGAEGFVEVGEAGDVDGRQGAGGECFGA